MRQKGSIEIIAIFVVLLALVGGGAYYFGYDHGFEKVIKDQKDESTTPSSVEESPETANWKTYKNTKVGFQIKYPVRFSQPGLPSGPRENNLANGTEDDTHIIFGTSSNDSFGIQVFPFSGNSDALTISSQATAIPPYDWQGKTTTIQKNATSITNTPALLITANYKNSNELPFTAAFLVGKNHGFIFNFSQNYNTTELNQILQTFKFTP